MSEIALGILGLAVVIVLRRIAVALEAINERLVITEELIFDDEEET